MLGVAGIAGIAGPADALPFEETLDMAPPCAGILSSEATPEGERK